MKKILPLVSIASLILSACAATATSTVDASATKEPTRTPRSVEPTPGAESRLKVNEETLDGLEITVWYPWYGVEASLFEIFVREFNQKNQWGILVSAQGQVNFTNLYEAVNASLPTADKP